MQNPNFNQMGLGELGRGGRGSRFGVFVVFGGWVLGCVMQLVHFHRVLCIFYVVLCTLLSVCCVVYVALCT